MVPPDGAHRNLMKLYSSLSAWPGSCATTTRVRAPFSFPTLTIWTWPRVNPSRANPAREGTSVSNSAVMKLKPGRSTNASKTDLACILISPSLRVAPFFASTVAVAMAKASLRLQVDDSRWRGLTASGWSSEFYSSPPPMALWMWTQAAEARVRLRTTSF